ncbi:hypothetical protein JJB09_06315 [Rhizobium sp. KVB221]|uniref:Uncharacterized protein n=1 Tax=Rhizobium setariae TaxID=2801340 RepID=A0A936YJV6_9HYPH|nr:hypothetical protein [Rhizobium setariae]MBL0371635.1 hypothetical protein [Rhizobium setariae]
MRLFSRRILILTSVLLAMLTGTASAADVYNPSPDTAVSEYGVTTYLDLARHFVPDIKATDNGYVGSKRVALRHIGGKGYEGADESAYGFYDLAAVRMKAEGKERLLVLFDFAQAAKAAQGLAVLALYELDNEPRLLDAADIGFDQGTYFFDQTLMPIAEGSDAILTMSSHFNSNQTYTTQALAMVKADRLELIGTALLFDERTCGLERRQTIRYAADPARGKPYAPISVTVTESAMPTDETCEGTQAISASEREIRITYTWNAADNKYRADSDNLTKLAIENERRF